MPRLVLVLLLLAVGLFLWQFVNFYSNNIYVQSSPITGILGDFRVAANLFVIIGLILTLVAMKTHRTIH